MAGASSCLIFLLFITALSRAEDENEDRITITKPNFGVLMPEAALLAKCMLLPFTWFLASEELCITFFDAPKYATLHRSTQLSSPMFVAPLYILFQFASTNADDKWIAIASVKLFVLAAAGCSTIMFGYMADIGRSVGGNPDAKHVTCWCLELACGLLFAMATVDVISTTRDTATISQPKLSGLMTVWVPGILILMIMAHGAWLVPNAWYVRVSRHNTGFAALFGWLARTGFEPALAHLILAYLSVVVHCCLVLWSRFVFVYLQVE